MYDRHYIFCVEKIDDLARSVRDLAEELEEIISPEAAPLLKEFGKAEGLLHEIYNEFCRFEESQDEKDDPQDDSNIVQMRPHHPGKNTF